MGNLTDAIEALSTTQQRRAYRAQAWRDLQGLTGNTWNPRAGVTVTLNDAWLVRDAGNTVVGVGFDIGVTRNGDPVDLGAANPFIFVNPPLAVDEPLTAQQISQLTVFWANNGDNPTKAQINTALSNNGYDPAKYTLRSWVDSDGLRQFRLLEEAPLKALRQAVVEVLKDAVA